MRGGPVFARVALALLLELIGVSGNLLTIKEEWSYIDGNHSLPRLKLLTKSEILYVRLRMEPLKVNQTLRIVLTQKATGNSDSVMVKKSHDENSGFWWRWRSRDRTGKVKVKTRSHTADSNQLNIRPVWKLLFTYFLAQEGSAVNVTAYSDNHTLTTALYADHYELAPAFNVSVDIVAKNFLVAFMERGQNVTVRLCYQRKELECSGVPGINNFQINTDHNRTTTLFFPHIVPCICLQVYYSKIDPPRDTRCLLINTVLPGGGDVLSSSLFKLAGISKNLLWEPLCPSAHPKPTATLCWQHQTNHMQCFEVQNSTLQQTGLIYNMTDVDKHAHMCVKFSLNGSQRVHCPFSSEHFSKWEVVVVSGSRRLHVHLTSSVPGSFAAQLCMEQGKECVGKGNVHSVQMEQGDSEVEVSLPLPLIRQGLCVQVWRSEPILHGRRIICPDYTHRRWGLIVAVPLALLAVIMMLVILTCVLVKKRTTVWRSAERKPVLLVCSSDNEAHVSAVCALASGLQEELRMDVHLAQWGLCTTQASLARLGPIPWLYGQCQVVQRAGGMVLVAWSTDALGAFVRWRQREEENDAPEKDKWKKGNVKNNREGLAWRNAQLEEMREKQSEGWMEKAKETPSVTAPLLNAALSHLWAGLQGERRGKGFGLLCFQGLCGNCHIPKDLRGIRRYCLPRDLPSLIHDLDLQECGPGGGVKNVIDGWCCWPRLFSKALAFWLSQRLAQRLEAWLPQKDSEREDRVRSKHSAKQSLKSDVGRTVKKRLRKKTKKGKAPSSRNLRKKGLEYNAVTEKEILGLPI